MEYRGKEILISGGLYQKLASINQRRMKEMVMNGEAV
jgi:hypothetical protein